MTTLKLKVSLPGLGTRKHFWSCLLNRTGVGRWTAVSDREPSLNWCRLDRDPKQEESASDGVGRNFSGRERKVCKDTKAQKLRVLKK